MRGKQVEEEARVILEIKTSDGIEARKSPRRRSSANTLAARDRIRCVGLRSLLLQSEVISTNRIMRQTLILAPMLALACVTSSHAEESTSATTMEIGGLALTPYGQFDQFVGRSAGFSNDASPGVAPGVRSKVDLLNGGLSTSNLGLRGRAKIAEGADVVFDLSAFINPEGGSFGRTGDKSVTVAGATFPADPLFSRAANVGFDFKGIGTLKVGADIAPLFFSIIRSNPLGDSMVFGPLSTLTFINSGISGGTNWQKGIFFNSATFDGFWFRAAYSFGEDGGVYVSPASANDAAGHAGRNWALSANYSSSTFGAMLNYQKVNRNNVIGNFSTSTLTVDNTNAWMVGASYNLGFAKIFGHVGGFRDESSPSSPFYAGRQRIYELSLSVPVAGGDVLAAVGKRDASGDVAATPDVAILEDGAPGGSNGRRMATLGYNYHLFRNTDIYALLSSDRTHTNVVNTSSGTVSNIGASATNFGVGGRFTF
jgi:predicted porin